ncbi:MAG: peptidoglycan-binding protein [Desulfobacterales bacterium]|nr:MAG: peptidoglycan-binding protein [Desulfobacterales bacterium]
MKSKAKSDAKASTKGKMANQKTTTKSQSGFDLGGSLLKMNEFTLIIVGALVVTVLVFFLFFRSPDPGQRDAQPKGTADNGVVQRDNTSLHSSLEQRIADIELSVSRLAASAPEPVVGPNAGNAKPIMDLDHRITRLEQAVTLKLDALMERIGKMEARLAALKNTSPVSRSVVTQSDVNTSKSGTAAPTRAPLKKKAVTKIKKPKKKVNMFHTVKKGETLWSISKAYNTSVPAIRKLNNLTAKDRIYPGNNLIVR